MKIKYILPIAIIIGIIFIWKFMDSKKEEEIQNLKPVEKENTEILVENIEPETTEIIATKKTISITDNGFSPSDIQINTGDTLVFTNNSQKDHWPASNNHPTHEIYSEFDPKKPITPGSSWEFKFNKAGSWKYHDHLSPRTGGTITVK